MLKFLILVFNYECATVIYTISIINLKQIYIIFHTFDNGMIGGVNYYMLTVKLMVSFWKLLINVVFEWVWVVLKRGI